MKRRFLPVAGVAAAVGLGLGGVASETISIGARPTVLRWSQTTMISGGIGGRFAVEIGGSVNRLVRARVEGAMSNVLTIGQRPSVTLQQRPPGSFRVHVNAMRPLWRRRVVLAFSSVVTIAEETRSLLAKRRQVRCSRSWV